MRKIDLKKLWKENIDIKSAPKAERMKFYKRKEKTLKYLFEHHRLKYVKSQKMHNGTLLHYYRVETFCFHSRQLFVSEMRLDPEPFDPIGKNIFWYRISDKYSS